MTKTILFTNAIKAASNKEEQSSLFNNFLQVLQSNGLNKGDASTIISEIGHTLCLDDKQSLLTLLSALKQNPTSFDKEDKHALSKFEESLQQESDNLNDFAFLSRGNFYAELEKLGFSTVERLTKSVELFNEGKLSNVNFPEVSLYSPENVPSLSNLFSDVFIASDVFIGSEKKLSLADVINTKVDLETLRSSSEKQFNAHITGVEKALFEEGATFLLKVLNKETLMQQLQDFDTLFDNPFSFSLSLQADLSYDQNLILHSNLLSKVDKLSLPDIYFNCVSFLGSVLLKDGVHRLNKSVLYDFFFLSKDIMTQSSYSTVSLHAPAYVFDGISHLFTYMAMEHNDTNFKPDLSGYAFVLAASHFNFSEERFFAILNGFEKVFGLNLSEAFDIDLSKNETLKHVLANLDDNQMVSFVKYIDENQFNNFLSLGISDTARLASVIRASLNVYKSF